MKKLVFLLILSILIIASKANFSTWDYDSDLVNDFNGLNGWFDKDYNFYLLASTDVSLIPDAVTSQVNDFPYSVSSVITPTLDADILYYNDIFALNRWQDRIIIKKLFSDYEDYLNYRSAEVGELAHPLFLNNGVIRDELSFEDFDVLFKFEIDSIRIVNNFAVVFGKNLYGYVKGEEIVWLENKEMPSIDADGIYYLVYDSGAWWFFGNQSIPIDEDKDDSKLGNKGWSSSGEESSIDNDNKGKDDSNILVSFDSSYGLSNEVLDEIYESDISEYKKCEYFNGNYRICLFVTNIKKGQDFLKASLGVGLGRDEFDLNFIKNTTFELSRQNNGTWVSLPPQPKTWMNRIISVFVSEEETSVGVYQNGKFLGVPKFR